MNTTEHWQHIYQTRSTQAVSWYAPQLTDSLRWVTRLCPQPSARIVDVGAGAGTLVDDLLARGYTQLTAMDLSAAALQHSQQRMGQASANVQWLVADATQAPLAAQAYDLWHDRAVFHFLTQADQQQAYVVACARALHPGGHAVLATFGPQGAQRCSGLPVQRYNAAQLAHAMGPRFALIGSELTMHHTPSGAEQQFLYAAFERLAD